jgi:hypothetical protein
MPIGKGGRRMLFPWDEPLAKPNWHFDFPCTNIRSTVAIVRAAGSDLSNI